MRAAITSARPCSCGLPDVRQSKETVRTYPVIYPQKKVDVKWRQIFFMEKQVNRGTSYLKEAIDKNIGDQK